MKILPGRRADTLEEAVLLAFGEAGKGDLSPDVATVFASASTNDKISAEAERSINTTVHGRYGRSAMWHGIQWLTPVAQPRYDTAYPPNDLLCSGIHGCPGNN